MSRPDVALVTSYPPAGDLHGGSSGVASYSANLARSLARHGLDVAVVAPRAAPTDPPRHLDGDVTVHRVGVDGDASMDATVRAALRLSPRTVHVQHEWFLWGGPSTVPSQFRGMARLRAASAPPSVATLHQVVRPRHVDETFTALHDLPRTPRLVGAGFAALQSVLRRGPDRVIVHEPAFRDALPGSTLVRHGLERGSSLDRGQARRRLGLGDDLVVLQFGFVAPYKGIEEGLRAVEAAGPGVLGVVAGGAHPRRGDQLARDLEARFAHTARFTGFVPDGDVETWFRAADVALLPYPRPHASSGVLALALAHDCPVLLSPALAETVEAPDDLVAPAATADLAARLRRLAGHPEELERLRTCARDLARGRGWDAVAAQHARLYEELSHAHGTAGRRVRPTQPRRRGTAGRVRAGTAGLAPGGHLE